MKLKIILLTIFFIQVARTNPIHDVIADLTLKIAQVKTSIDTILQNGGILIKKTHKSIAEIITGAETEIQGQLDELDNIVTQAEQEAQEANKDISQCVITISGSLSGLNFQKFDQCAGNHNLDLLGQEFGNLRMVKERLSNSINLCLSKNPLNVEALKICVENDIANAQRKSEEIESKMTAVCDKATKDASSCSQAVFEELDKIITKVAHDFKQCFEQIIN